MNIQFASTPKEKHLKFNMASAALIFLLSSTLTHADDTVKPKHCQKGEFKYWVTFVTTPGMSFGTSSVCTKIPLDTEAVLSELTTYMEKDLSRQASEKTMINILNLIPLKE